jgi:DNA invertase Pin-like site-specific DNA recombinase
MTTKLRAAAYIRVSTDEQTEYSPAAQLKALSHYANNNNMLLLQDYTYIDEGISGRKAEKRPAFMRMIAAAKSKNHPFDVILVHKFDRFARNREDSVVYKSLLRKQCGIKVVSVTETIEDDRISLLVEPMLEALAEYYSVNLAEEVKKGMTEKAQRGEYQTVAPLGYKWENGSLIINEQEKPYIEYIFNSFLNGMSQQQIARNLNSMGVKSHRGNQIENRSVQYILYNPVYCGYSRWTPTGRMSDKRIFDSPDSLVMKGNHPSIISKETFDKVQEKLATVKATHSRKARPQSEYKHYLSGIFRCGNCGASLAFSGKSQMLQCWKYNHSKCDVSHSITITKAEKALLDELITLSTVQDITPYLKHITPITSTLSETKVLTAQIKELEKKLKRLKNGYLDGVFDLMEYKNEKTTIDAEISDLTAKLNKIEKPVFDPVAFQAKAANAYSVLTSPTATNEEKNTAIKSVIEKVVYDKATKSLHFYYFY